MRFSGQNYADALKRYVVHVLPVSFLSDLVPYILLTAAERTSRAVALYIYIMEGRDSVYTATPTFMSEVRRAFSQSFQENAPHLCQHRFLRNPFQFITHQ
jgi:hypothetical protein